MIEIRKPLFEGKGERKIGIAEYRLKLEGAIVEINITYRTKEGLRLYPDPFYARKVDIVRYPVELASGTKVYVVPIADLSTSPTMEHQYIEYNLDCHKCNVRMKQILHKNIVSYKCPKCGDKSNLEWEVERLATEQPEKLEKPSDVSLLSEIEEQQNLL